MMIKRLVFAAIGAFAASMAFAGSASAAPQTINLCTGGTGFPYAIAGQMIADAARGSSLIEVNVVNSKGTIDNIRRTVAVDANDPEACHAFIGQPDVLVGEKKKNPAFPVRQINSLHREYLHVLCSNSSGIDDLEDITSKHTVNIGPNGSGAWALWQNFIAEDASYKDIPVKNESDKIALGAVASGETDCMIVAAGLGNSTMQEANDYYSEDISLVEATDWDFNDAKDIRGERLYEFVDLPRTYKNLQGFFGGSRETVSWNAGVYVNPERIADEAVLGEFVTYVNRAKTGIVQKYGK